MFRLPALVVCLALSLAAQKAPFDTTALMKLARISEPQLSPDGRTVAFVAQTIELEKNGRPQQIWTVPVEGGPPRQITRDGTQNTRPRWSPDSRQIAFVSNRGGTSQIWLMDPDGANARQLTNIATEADGVIFSPTGKHLLFTSDVFPECADEVCNQKLAEAEKASPVKARIHTTLLYRHWNQWRGARRRHLMVVASGGGPVKDLTPGHRDAPPFSLGGADDYAIAPDGNEVCFVMKPDPEPAINTNSELFVVPLAGGEVRKITLNPGADNSPSYSPDGRYIAWRSQARAGYESDRWRLMVMERAGARSFALTEALDRWVTGFTWTPDSTRLFFTIEDRGRTAVQMIPVNGGASRVVITGASHIDDLQFTRDSKTLIYSEHTASRPLEIFRASSTGGPAAPLTRLNDGVLGACQLSAPEELWVDAPDKARIHSFLVKPANFQSGRKYPALFLIHGGPQGAWGESWTYRWNAQVFAGAGYVVVMPNPRGSTGYGQRFIDEINADWGGKAYDDIMAVADKVAELPYVDGGRMAAAGASYGGYMINWMLGHTYRFKAFVSHAGVFDLRSMAGETEELWFPLWEFRGMPWDNPEEYSRWSPSHFVKDFQTPTLVTHGELDYRVPYGQGLQLFTGLQMQKVPSKLLLFPDEGHWIGKPLNAMLWYRTVLDWIGEWTKARREQK